MKKTIAVFMACMVVLTTLAVPSFATDYQSKYNFWNWAYDHSWFLGKAITSLADNVCTISEDGLHHATTHSANEVNADGEYTYTCVCDLCAETFTAYATDLETAYENATPDYIIDNKGCITELGEWVVVPSYSGFTYELKLLSDTVGVLEVDGTSSNYPSLTLEYEFDIPANTDFYIGGKFGYVKDDETLYGLRVNDWVCYEKSTGWASFGTHLTLNDENPDIPVYSGNSGNFTHYKVKSGIISVASADPKTFDLRLPYVNYFDFDVGVDDAPIFGGGSISYTDDNSNNEIIENQFFDQSTNTYHNPVTDTSSTVESWNYDYSTREWTGYTENGEVKIVYGDENISVVEGGNTYNYYYATPDSSGGNGGSAGGDGSDGGESIWDKLGELLGTLLGGLIDLITGVIDGLLDSLINLVKTTLEKLGQVVDLFGSFGDALSALWTWLPEDIVTILTAGVSVVVFASVIKLFI